MRFGFNDHYDGNTRVGGPDPLGRLDRAARLDRLRGRLDQPRRVLVRDFIIFELKLFLDWLKGPIVAQVAVAAFVIDLIRPGGRRLKLFYRVMDLGERLDQWLSLYGASRHAGEDPEGLLGESREGSRTLLGQMEHIVHRVVVGDHPEGSELYPRSRVDEAAFDAELAAAQQKGSAPRGPDAGPAPGRAESGASPGSA